jgi:hypothetical protein
MEGKFISQNEATLFKVKINDFKTDRIFRFQMPLLFQLILKFLIYILALFSSDKVTIIFKLLYNLNIKFPCVFMTMRTDQNVIKFTNIQDAHDLLFSSTVRDKLNIANNINETWTLRKISQQNWTNLYNNWPFGHYLWSSGQSFWLQIQRS